MSAINPEIRRRLFWSLLGITVFAAAMGYLEGVVVVYLRSIMKRRLDWYTIEITREAATLIMLVIFAFFAGRNARERTGVFLWIFGVWDIVYYLGLKIWLDWPESLMTMDTLFYIPCTWSSPVYVPVMFSCIMMMIGSLLFYGIWTDYLIRAWRWGVFGWIIGCVAGIALAVFNRTPAAVSAMGFAFLCGLIVAGTGITFVVNRRFPQVFPVIIFSIAFGAFSGWLGHMARSMFYTGKLSPFWACGAAISLNLLVLIFWRASSRTRHSD